MRRPLQTELEKQGFKVQQFDEYHFRVNGEFDFWLNHRARPLSWHDRLSGERGYKPEAQIVPFIRNRLADRTMKVAEKDEFIGNLKQIGWSQVEAEKEWSARQCQASPHSGHSAI
jgi:hypothetical protein